MAKEKNQKQSKACVPKIVVSIILLVASCAFFVHSISANLSQETLAESYNHNACWPAEEGTFWEPSTDAEQIEYDICTKNRETQYESRSQYLRLTTLTSCAAGILLLAALALYLKK